MDKKIVLTSKAPKPVGPYSQGIIANGFVYTAGQGAIDPATNQWAGGDISQQTKLVLDNITAILTESGSSLDKVVKCNVYLKNKDHFSVMNEIYKSYFGSVPPARTTVVTNLLRDDMLIEIEAIATL